MKKEVISSKQAISMMILFITGSSVVLGTAEEAGADLWLSIIISLICALLVALIYARILSLFPEKDFFDSVIYIFGKIFGSAICILYIWFSFHLASLVLVNYQYFIEIVGLSATPEIVITISIMFLVVWGVKVGIEMLGRWSSLFVILLFCLIYFTIPFLVPMMDIRNLQPFLYAGIKPVLNASLSTFTFPFTETVMFLGILSSLNSKKSYYKVYAIGILLGGAIIFSVSVAEMLVLGAGRYAAYNFPAYAAVSMINIKEFITRIEIIVSTVFLIGGFIKISMCTLVCCRGISKLFSFEEYRFLVTPIGILIVITAITSYDSIMEMSQWITEIWNYYALLFEVILPIVILIGAEIKVRSKKNLIKKSY
jgi:spore germination protein KB